MVLIPVAWKLGCGNLNGAVEAVSHDEWLLSDCSWGFPVYLGIHPCHSAVGALCSGLP